MWTFQNDLGLNLCVVPSTSSVVAISEDSLVSVVATTSSLKDK